MEKVNSNKKQGNLWLWILLGVLVVIIVVLIIVVAVVRINGQEALGGLFGGDGWSGSSSGGGDSSSGSNISSGNRGGENGNGDGGDVPEEIELGPEGLVAGSEGMGDEEALQVAANSQTLISDRFNATKNIDEAADLYQQAIDEAKDENKQLAAVLLMTRKAEFMAYHGQCDEAIDFINSIDVSNMTVVEKQKIYTSGVEVGMDCDDVDEAKKWSNALSNVEN